MRNKKRRRKERVVEVRVAFDGEVTLSGMSPPGMEPLQFFGLDGKPITPKYIEVGRGYSRSKPGLKVLQRAGADPSSIYREPTRALLRFATLLAVDTNTRCIDGAQVSVAACVLIRNVGIDDTGRWFATLHEQAPYEFHDATVSPERLGWMHIIQRAIASESETPAGLIVDSELDRLGRYNRQEEPIVEGFDLPAGFQLMYASAERGTTEFVGNAALARCDRLATSVLDRIECDPAVREWTTNDPPSRWVKRHRAWVNG